MRTTSTHRKPDIIHKMTTQVKHCLWDATLGLGVECMLFIPQKIIMPMTIDIAHI